MGILGDDVMPKEVRDIDKFFEIVKSDYNQACDDIHDYYDEQTDKFLWKQFHLAKNYRIMNRSGDITGYFGVMVACIIGLASIVGLIYSIDVSERSSAQFLLAFTFILIVLLVMMVFFDRSYFDKKERYYTLIEDIISEIIQERKEQGIEVKCQKIRCKHKSW